MVPIHIDLRPYSFEGVRALDASTIEITLNRDFPPWMSLAFFSPMPWEACRFYSQAAAADQNLGLDRYPVGTGPYMLVENRPNYRIVLEKNPNYRLVPYPGEGAPGDAEAGGKALPFIDREQVPAGLLRPGRTGTGRHRPFRPSHGGEHGRRHGRLDGDGRARHRAAPDQSPLSALLRFQHARWQRPGEAGINPVVY
jgi:hypothetical protein